MYMQDKRFSLLQVHNSAAYLPLSAYIVFGLVSVFDRFLLLIVLYAYLRFPQGHYEKKCNIRFCHQYSDLKERLFSSRCWLGFVLTCFILLIKYD